MNRRVLDNVVITALDKHGDENLTKMVSDEFGTGTLVQDPKIPVVAFDKSMLGLQVTNMSNMIRKLAAELMPTEQNPTILDSDGKGHPVSKEAVAILKGLTFYRITCPPSIAECIGNLMQEIDNHFKGYEHKEIVTTTISVDVLADEDEDTKTQRNVNLMKYCRSEVFGLLREAGVSIG